MRHWQNKICLRSSRVEIVIISMFAENLRIPWAYQIITLIRYYIFTFFIKHNFLEFKTTFEIFCY